MSLPSLISVQCDFISHRFSHLMDSKPLLPENTDKIYFSVIFPTICFQKNMVPWSVHRQPFAHTFIEWFTHNVFDMSLKMWAPSIWCDDFLWLCIFNLIPYICWYKVGIQFLIFHQTSGLFSLFKLTLELEWTNSTIVHSYPGSQLWRPLLWATVIVMFSDGVNISSAHSLVVTA